MTHQLSSSVSAYIAEAKHWLTSEQLLEHTGVHPWTMRTMMKGSHPTQKITREEKDQIIHAFEQLSNPTVREVVNMTQLPEVVVREVLIEFRKLCPDLFNVITQNGGQLRYTPDLLRREMKRLYVTDQQSSRDVATLLLDSYGVRVTDAGVRKVLQNMGVHIRDKQQSTLIALNKLSVTQERWIANTYTASRAMTIPLLQAAFQNQFQASISAGTVQRVLDSHNIEVRGSRKQFTKRRVKQIDRLRKSA